MIGGFWRKLGLAWRDSERIAEEVDEELDFHLRMRVAELVRRGIDPESAERRAAADFGDIEATRRHYVRRRTRRAAIERLRGWAGSLAGDARFGVRVLAKRPGSTLTAVAILGFGIGAPTTVLTIVNAIFHEPPEHIADPDRLARVFRAWAGGGGGSLSHPDFRDYRRGASAFTGLAAFGGDAVAADTLDGREPDQLSLLFVSDNYFDVLGA